MADAFGQAALPPLGFPERPGLVTLPFQIVFTQIIGEGLDVMFSFHVQLNG
jgi:hypothetical protein